MSRYLAPHIQQHIPILKLLVLLNCKCSQSLPKQRTMCHLLTLPLLIPLKLKKKNPSPIVIWEPKGFLPRFTDVVSETTSCLCIVRFRSIYIHPSFSLPERPNSMSAAQELQCGRRSGEILSYVANMISQRLSGNGEHKVLSGCFG